MDSSQKYLLAGSLSLTIAAVAFASGAVLIFRTPSRLIASPLPIATALPTVDDDSQQLPVSVTEASKIAPSPVAAGYTRYVDDQYRISFDYPSTWVLGPDLSFSKQQIQVSFAPVFYEKDAGDFTNGLLTYLTSICSADGPTGSIQCLADQAKVTAYTNALGVNGYSIARIKTNEQFIPTNHMTLVAQTVYAFPIAHPEVFAVVFSPTVDADVQPTRLKSLADTFQYGY